MANYHFHARLALYFIITVMLNILCCDKIPNHYMHIWARSKEKSPDVRLTRQNINVTLSIHNSWYIYVLVYLLPLMSCACICHSNDVLSYTYSIDNNQNLSKLTWWVLTNIPSLIYKATNMLTLPTPMFPDVRFIYASV